jgi:hypothetical protein
MGSSQSRGGSLYDPPTFPTHQQYLLHPVQTSYMTLDRIIAGDCDFLSSHRENTIRVGVMATLPNKPFSGQVLCIGDGPPKRLTKVLEKGEKVSYQFEDTQFSVFPCKENSVCYSLNVPGTINVIREIHPKIRRLYRPMSFDSPELDYIETIFRGLNQ